MQAKNKIKTGLSAFIAGSALLSTAASAALVDIDIGGQATGGAGNDVVITVDLAAEIGVASGQAIEVIGLGWNLTLESADPSWQSEATIDFNQQLVLTVAPGINEAGTGTYSSNGMLSLVPLMLDFAIADGVLIITLYETFDDLSVSPDGMWGNGSTLTVGARLAGAVPVPAAVWLLASALGALGVRSRFARH